MTGGGGVRGIRRVRLVHRRREFGGGARGGAEGRVVVERGGGGGEEFGGGADRARLFVAPRGASTRPSRRAALLLPRRDAPRLAERDQRFRRARDPRRGGRRGGDGGGGGGDARARGELGDGSPFASRFGEERVYRVARLAPIRLARAARRRRRRRVAPRRRPR